ncbi:acyl-CoA desaturase [Candidatus Microgenomates bacterium]|nr:acyl-CoA desaturase [Candidatus Microgenomates bacterium]
MLWLARLGKSVYLGAPLLGFIVTLYLAVTGRFGITDILLVIPYFLGPGFGITIGFHRFATHGAFRANRMLGYGLLALGSMAGEGSLDFWVRNHLKHHWNSDDEGDPHSPWYGWLDRFLGLVFAHVGWLFNRNDVSDVELPEYTRELFNDSVVGWIDRLFIVFMVLYYLIPFEVQGVNGIWSALTAAFCRYNVTFAVNSVCHRWGSSPFKTGDHSTNNWVVGILGLGEGWHNNHHAFQRAAFHGLSWWQVDFSGYLISLFEFLKLVGGVQRPDREQITKKLIAAGKP